MKQPIIKDTADITFIPTSHGVGHKQILLSNDETRSAVTQIALTAFGKGEEVEAHSHQTMDEHYIFRFGEGVMTVDGVAYPCHAGNYVMVPCGASHSLRAVSDMEFITIGVAYDKNL